MALRIALCLVVWSCFVISSAVVNADNTCGDNLLWELNGDTLTISGTGDMYKFSVGRAPWYNNRSSIKSVVISEGVTSIGVYAFVFCSQITNITIPNTVTTIEKLSFSSCTGLKNVMIPRSVTTIGSGAFEDCSSLISIDVDENNQNFTSVDGVLLSRDGTSLIMFPVGRTDNTYSIPHSVTKIIGDAFSGWRSLTHIIIPDSVLEIESCAFDNCYKLVNVTIPNSVLSIGLNSFRGCSRLSTVFYLGSEDIFTENIFSSKDFNICVPPDYNSTTFCGNNITSTEPCQTFQSMFNRCFELTEINGSVIQMKRKNASEWESQSDGCREYYCDNESGPVSWSICNNSNDVSARCDDGRCVIDSPPDEKRWSVAVEMDDGVKMKDYNLSESLTSLSVVCGIPADVLSYGYEIDKEGLVIRLILYFEDEETAKLVSATIEEMSKSDECSIGILCRTKSVNVVFIGKEISSSSRALNNAFLIVTVIMGLQLP